jgi:hypothetical protein
MSLDQDQVGSAGPNSADSPLSLCLAKLSADRMTSNLSHSFIVNTPPFNTATEKDILPRSPLVSPINPFFPPVTLSTPVQKRPRDRTARGTIESMAATPTRRLPLQNNDVNAEIRALTGMTVLKTRLCHDTHFLP